MLGWLGEESAGKMLLDAVENVCEQGVLTRDLGGKATTKEVTAAVCKEIRQKTDKKSTTS